MPQGFNELETSILRWMQDYYGNPALSAQIESAKLVKRKWTGVGFYVYLDVSRETLPVDVDDFEGWWPIRGPDLRSEDIHLEGSSILWGEGGWIDCIEMFAYGDFFNEDVKSLLKMFRSV